VNVHWPDRTSKEFWRKTDQEQVLSQLRRRKWNCLGHNLRRSDDSIAKQVLQWAIEEECGQRTLGGQYWNKKCGERTSTTAGGKMEAAAQDREMEISGLWTMFHWER